MEEAELVKELRKKIGAPILDCLKAIKECKQDLKKAAQMLRERGYRVAEERKENVTAAGVISSYLHHDQKIGVLLEVNCESDFVARNKEFQEFGREVAMQIASFPPAYLAGEDVPEEVMTKISSEERNDYLQKACLLEQPFIKNPQVKIKDLLKEKIAKFGENIRIKRFTCYQLGQ